MNGPVEQTTKRRRGCFFWGCITSLIMLLIMMIAVVSVLHYINKMIVSYTDDKPLTIPTVQLSQPEIDKLRERVDAFGKALDENKATSPLILTSDEINALIATSPQWKVLKGLVYVGLEGDQLKGQVSVPLEKVHIPFLKFKGRYLNGTGGFTLAFKDGNLHIWPKEITVKGKSLPEPAMQSLRKNDLGQNFNDPKATAELQKFKEIEIKDSKLIVTPKEGPEKAQ